MNKITIKKTPFKLLGKVVSVGTTLDFKAKDFENKTKTLEDFKGFKVISIFPDINTSICDFQTIKIINWASQNKKVNFISMTTDSVETIAEWCATKNKKNINILSDKEFGDFGKKTNLLIPKINKLARGFIILDNENKIIDISINKELVENPDFDLVEKYIHA